MVTPATPLTVVADVCLSCGCHRYEDDHHDHRNITLADAWQAAEAADLGLEQVGENFYSGVIDVVTANPADTVLEHSTRPVVLSDIDNTISLTYKAKQIALAARFDIYPAMDKPNYTPENQPFELHLPHSQDEWFHSFTHDPKNVALYTADANAVNALTKIAETHVVAIGTERHPDLHQVTKDWLAEWAPGLGQCQLMVGHGEKLRFSRGFSEWNPLVWIDDDPQFLITGLHPGVRIFMPQRPWTPSEVPPGVTVFDDWGYVLDYLGV